MQEETPAPVEETPAPAPAPAPVEAVEETPAPVEAEEQPKTIPFERFAEVLAERNQLRDEVASVKELREKLEGVDTERAAWSEERAFMQAGLTNAEGVEVARFLYSKIEGEKPAIGDWLKSPPPAVAGYMTKTETAETAPAAPSVDANKGTTATNTPTTGQALSAEAIGELKREAVKTGDWSNYRSARENLLASIRAAR